MLRTERRVHEERAQQAEQHRTVAHEDRKVRLTDRDAVERLEARRAEHARQRQQVDDTDDDEHGGDEMTHHGRSPEPDAMDKDTRALRAG